MESVKKNSMMEPLDIPESEIPWYRWRWLFVVTLLLFFPAVLLIGLTGNVYGKQNGEAFKLSNKFKYLSMFTGLLLVTGQVIRSL